MTDKERLERYARIIKWGKEYIDYIKAAGLLEADRLLLEEYIKAHSQLEEQCASRIIKPNKKSK